MPRVISTVELKCLIQSNGKHHSSHQSGPHMTSHYRGHSRNIMYPSWREHLFHLPHEITWIPENSKSNGNPKQLTNKARFSRFPCHETEPNSMKTKTPHTSLFFMLNKCFRTRLDVKNRIAIAVILISQHFRSKSIPIRRFLMAEITHTYQPTKHGLPP